MALSQKIILLLSSFFCFIFTSCHVSKYNKLRYDKIVFNEQFITPIVKKNQVVKYNTTIDVLTKHLSGILVIKQLDSVTTRIVFVTELGMKMFDFEAKENKLQVLYVFEPLNKPNIVESLKRNFGNILLLDIYNVNGGASSNANNQPIYGVFYQPYKRFFETDNSKKLVLQQEFKNRKRISKTNYVFEEESKQYTRIICKQYGIVKFKFELNLIKPTNE